MKTTTLKLPVEIDPKGELELKMIVGAIFFEKGYLSSGQAATFIGISKRKFLETVGKYGVSIFGETIDDLKTTSEFLKS